MIQSYNNKIYGDVYMYVCKKSVGSKTEKRREREREMLLKWVIRLFSSSSF